MSILRATSLPFYRNPSLWPGLAALSSWLEDHHYSQHARESIVRHAAAEGTPTGSVYLEAEDEADATEVFVTALPIVPATAESWSDPANFIDVESLLEARGSVSSAPSAPGRRPWSIEGDREADRGRLAADPELAAIIRDEPVLMSIYADCLPPIRGGSPAAKASDPMAFPRIKDAADCRRDMADVAGWYRDHPGA